MADKTTFVQEIKEIDQFNQMQNKLAAVVQLDAVKHNHRGEKYGQAIVPCCRPGAKDQQRGLVFGISEDILQNSTENPILRS